MYDTHEPPARLHHLIRVPTVGESRACRDVTFAIWDDGFWVAYDHYKIYAEVTTPHKLPHTAIDERGRQYQVMTHPVVRDGVVCLEVRKCDVSTADADDTTVVWSLRVAPLRNFPSRGVVDPTPPSLRDQIEEWRRYR